MGFWIVKYPKVNPIKISFCKEVKGNKLFFYSFNILLNPFIVSKLIKLTLKLLEFRGQYIIKKYIDCGDTKTATRLLFTLLTR